MARRVAKGWRAPGWWLAVLVLGAMGYTLSPVVLRDEVLVRLEGDQPLEVVATISDRPLTRHLGLMFREELPQNRGMLFRYRKAKVRSFWMKHTRIPLDIVFIGPDLRVLNVREAEPCRTAHCPRYRSEGPARYVLEVNRGLCRRHGVRKGTRVVMGGVPETSRKQSSTTP